MILLPPWFPLNVYDFGCWARQTIVPLTVVAAHRPTRPLGFDARRASHRSLATRGAPGWRTWAGRFHALDRALHVYERHPVRGRCAGGRSRQCAEWILRRQEADGCWGGIQPPWVYSIMALHLLGYPLDHPALARAIEGLDCFAIVENGMRRFEACQSPVWDTALAMVAPARRGRAADAPGAGDAARRWLASQEIRVAGDWAVRRPTLEPSGWAFEFENDNYPDVDDTAEVVLALRARPATGRRRTTRPCGAACSWTLGMQCRDGGWARLRRRQHARALPASSRSATSAR